MLKQPQSSSKPRVLLLSAYDAGSHKRWREQLVASQPAFDWHVLALPPRFFRWRIRGNALTWLQEPSLQEHWDLLLVTSMVDLASIRGFHSHLARTPALLYMHENQFAYPDSGKQHSSAEPKMVNLYSAVAADGVVFNSEWNRDSFLSEAHDFLDKLPDGLPDGVIRQIRDKSRVIPVPIEDYLFRERTTPHNFSCPHLLWNHRWEYDKSPDRLLLLLDRLVEMGQEFRVSVVGEQFRNQPRVFEEIWSRHRSRLVLWGFMESREAYDRLLHEADVVVSTALHDFQGLSMLEAMASGCLALAPDRLAYPEYVPASQRYTSLVGDPRQEARCAADTLMSLLEQKPAVKPPCEWRLTELKRSYHDAIYVTMRSDAVCSSNQERTTGACEYDEGDQGCR
ncbi:DUF3524 domain-containing protein [Marinobacter sp. NP-4(2019)]|uniref:tRNA-queuosine alpha-mannosyltransferase domain-containing protein n=1 Tax=Marinobacter sp. NP-4(2019) TaxID=2488665 RepID=UPI000FC3D1BF|nr:DUF3524 domain-containing protein [Marinobacter sp. NP-4(2019)]AZT83375.1 DUF3524 domain-containing protein [Marinobacter sp. NP-4(2019)]